MSCFGLAPPHSHRVSNQSCQTTARFICADRDGSGYTRGGKFTAHVSCCAVEEDGRRITPVREQRDPRVFFAHGYSSLREGHERADRNACGYCDGGKFHAIRITPVREQGDPRVFFAHGYSSLREGHERADRNACGYCDGGKFHAIRTTPVREQGDPHAWGWRRAAKRKNKVRARAGAGTKCRIAP